MMLREWLKEQCIARGGKNADVLSMKFDPLICKDGFELSVQASYYHLCSPKEMLDDGDYKSVEIYSHGEEVPELMEYALRHDDSTYAYVPVDVLERLIDSHGGIK